MSIRALWAVRASVLLAFAATVWWCGPQAAAVLAARLDTAGVAGPRIDLDRVGFVTRPVWLDEPLLLAISAALSPWLDGDLGVLDDQAGRELRAGLSSEPWVRSVGIERLLPDRLRLRIDLRRPVLAVRSGDGGRLCLVDREAVMLPWVDTALPELRLGSGGWPGTMAVAFGQPATAAQVRAAVGIAIEWRDELAPLVPGCPPLLAIDATNLGERWIRGPEYPEIRIELRRSDGAGVLFGYDRPVDSPLPRVPVRSKALVLRNVLAQHPGLDGLIAGDLRFARRWADYLQPRRAGAVDPYGPWKSLPLPIGR